ncbi:MAG: apolipoprotein N-acyltransferase, partial [Deltaproteobacteria bacterium]|nr:apolipoprotein N-acyltransferase [Deltaproteobacteria bacterium]
MRKTCLVILTGLLYALAFPSYNLWPLIWIFAVPMFFVAEDLSLAHAFIFGLIAGIVAWSGSIYWIAYVIYEFGELNLLLSSFILFIFVVYLSIYFGVFSCIASGTLRSKHSIISLPGIWIILELLRSYALSGFPWGLAGHSQFPLKGLIQIAEFGGVYLISGIIMMANVAIYKAIKREFKPILLVIFVLTISFAWGNWRMDNLDITGKTLKVGIAQANISQEEKWLPEMITPTINIYSRLTKSALEMGADLIVWPETSCNFYLFRQWGPTSKIIGLSKRCNAHLLIGSPAYEDGKYFNRVWFIYSGKIYGYYDKVHLVPFGEYLPLASILQPIVGTLSQGISDFSKGKRFNTIDEAGILICFESIFPDMSRRLCKEKATYLVNVSNDAWFKTWATPEQHLQIAAFRAIENRRWLIRSVNHGISAFVDPFGRITASIGLLKEGVIIEEITKNLYITFYARYGP